jgi:tetratricopeptide (TPR) repeat protein
MIRPVPRMVWEGLAVFLLALALRAVHLHDISPIPSFLHPQEDALSYSSWAHRLASGDWLDRTRGVFQQSPLYPYVLALVEKISGGANPLWTFRAFQILLGSMSCVWIYIAGRLWFGSPAGLAAGLLLALYPFAIFSDALIQKSVLDIFLVSGILAVLGFLRQERRPGRAAVLGFLLGLLALTRETALPWIGLALIWLGLEFRGDPDDKKVKALALFVLCTALPLLPVGLRNAAVGGRFAVTTSNMGLTLFQGNRPGANGAVAPLIAGSNPDADGIRLASRALGRPASPPEASRYWIGQTVAAVRSQPGSWFRLMLRKWNLFWNRYEIPDDEDLYLHRRFSRPLRTLLSFYDFGALFSLALLGAVFTWSRRRELWIFYAFAASLAAVTACFAVAARYRFPIVPVLILFASAGIAEFAGALRRGLWAWAGTALAVGVCAFGYARFSLVPSSFFDGNPGAYSNWSLCLTEQKRYAEAAVLARRALELDPAHYDAYLNLGRALYGQGDLAGAESAYLRAVELSPQSPSAYNNLGSLAALRRDAPTAERYFLKALELNSRYALAWNNLGLLRFERRDYRGALECFRNAAEASPENAEIANNLGNAYYVLRDFPKAGQAFSRAVRLRPEDPLAHYNLGNVFFIVGASDPALREYREALRLAPGLSDAREQIARIEGAPAPRR